MTIFLASKSPRRQELLKQIGIEFEIIDIDINEHWNGKEQPRAYVKRIALEKALAGKNKLDNKNNIVVIGADTAVVLDDQILGKAVTIDDANQMLRNLSGRMHHVYTAVAIVSDHNRESRISTSRVCFRHLNTDEITAYCNTGEPLGKAGGYAIQGRAAVFIERLEGSYSGVMGLPLFETMELLRRV